MLKSTDILLLICILLASTAAVAGNARQSLASIALQAESFIDDYPFESLYPVRYELSKLDSRLRLKPCNQTLDIRFTHPGRTTGNTSLNIQCHAPVNWKLHLPVHIDLFDDVALTKTPLLRGQAIDTGNIIFRKKKISGLSQGYFTRKDAFDRLQARRNLPAGSILSPANVAQKMLVKSGQIVNIILNIKGLQIKSSGKALQSATLGKTIKVKNLQSSKIIQATVSGMGEVQVRF